jgi:hypothetical protein
MIRTIDYEFKVKTPVHTGSDYDSGTLKTLRRMKIITQEKKNFDFKDIDYLDIISSILYFLHKDIDFNNISQKRIYKIWEEWHNKILCSLSCSTHIGFIEKLCNLWGIKSLNNNVLEYINKIPSNLFLALIREFSHVIILLLRLKAKNKDEKYSYKLDLDLLSNYSMYVNMPYIHGNSIRGRLRRLLMYDFLSKIGIENKLKRTTYNLLFTGGTLNKQYKYDVNELLNNCPPLQLFGTSAGIQTVEGNLAVSHAFLNCIELGTGDNSFWNYLDVIFSTRHDTSKTEKFFEIIDEDSKKDKSNEDATQMKYEYEVFAVNSVLNHSFKCYVVNDLIDNVFNKTLELYKQNPYVGAKFSVGCGEIDLTQLNNDNNTKLYDELLTKNASKYKKYLESL